MEKTMTEHLTRDDFAKQLNTAFQVYFTPEKVSEAELIEVTEAQQRIRQDSFSLLFLLPPEVPIEQGNYTIEHPALATFDLFLVPISKSNEGVKFEAVFNRLIE